MVGLKTGERAQARVGAMLKLAGWGRGGLHHRDWARIACLAWALVGSTWAPPGSAWAQGPVGEAPGPAGAASPTTSAPPAAAADPAGTARLVSARASQPPHCMADGQWHDPVGASPLNLFDGRPDSAWVVCPEAAATADYAVDFTFAAPVRIDRIRVTRPPVGPDGAPNHPSVVEIGLHDSRLSTAWPIWFRTLSFDDGPHAQVALSGRMPWNPQLVNDVGFVERRRAAGHNQYDVPVPLGFDKLTLVLRAVDAGKGPVHLGAIELYLGEQRVPVQGLEAARAQHAEFLARGLNQALRGRFLVQPERVLLLSRPGEVFELDPADFDATRLTDTSVLKPVGRWRVQGGRLEMEGALPEVGKASPAKAPAKAPPKRPARPAKGEVVAPLTPDGYTVVSHRIDEAPTAVRLLDGPFAGTWAVRNGPPNAVKPATTPGSGAPTSGPGGKPTPPSGADSALIDGLGDDEDDGELPIP